MTVSATVFPVPPDNTVGINNGRQWVFTADDTGSAESLAEFADRSVQVECATTFGGGTVTIEGSNDGTNYRTLHDTDGNALTFTSGGLKQILEATAKIRAKMTGSTNPDVTVTLVGTRKRQ